MGSDTRYDKAAREREAKVDALAASTSHVDAAGLMGRELGELVWVVEGLLTEGLGILIGAPKIRKSWMVASLALSVACGGRALGAVQVEAGEVLHLALEDSERRIQSRLAAMLNGEHLPPGAITLQFAHDVAGGSSVIEEWLSTHPRARLVIIDTWGRYRDLAGELAHVNAYERDYEAARGIQALALRHHVAILLVHHRKKGATGPDWMESVSGSMGLPAACDTIWSLERKRGEEEAQLDVTGRDVEEESYGLRWDPDLSIWSLLGRIDDTLTGETREVLELLHESVSEGLSPRQIGTELGLYPTTIRKRLHRLLARSLVRRNGKFPKTKYTLSDLGEIQLRQRNAPPRRKAATTNYQDTDTESYPQTYPQTYPQAAERDTPPVTVVSRSGDLSRSNPERDTSVTPPLSRFFPNENNTLTPERDTVTPHISDPVREELLFAREEVLTNPPVSGERLSHGVTLDDFSPRDPVWINTELRTLVGPVCHAAGVTISAFLTTIPEPEREAMLDDFQARPELVTWWLTHKLT